MAKNLEKGSECYIVKILCKHCVRLSDVLECTLYIKGYLLNGSVIRR